MIMIHQQYAQPLPLMYQLVGMLMCVEMWAPCLCLYFYWRPKTNFKIIF